MDEKFRKNLLWLRNSRGWSQSELARRSGVGQSTIARIESGERRRVGWATVEALARALGVNTQALIGDDDAGSGDPGAKPEVGVMDVGELLRLYIQSDLFEADSPTAEELRWLSGLRVIAWEGGAPTARTASALIHARRAGRL